MSIHRPSQSSSILGPVDYAELCVSSNFSFLRGASHPEEFIARAAELGLSALAITDHNSFAGVVRAYSALKALKEARDEEVAPTAQAVPVRSYTQQDPSSRQKIVQKASPILAAAPPLPKLIIGTRLMLQDSPLTWIALPQNRAAYARLCQLLTLGKRRAAKGQCDIRFEEMLAHREGTIFIALPEMALLLHPHLCPTARAQIAQIARQHPNHAFIGAAPRYDGADQARFAALADLALRSACPLVAVGDVIMHHAARRQLADVLTAIRESCTVESLGQRALPNAERRLRGPSDMARIFHAYPGALRRSTEIAARCGFCLSELSYEYPDEGTKVETSHARLKRLTYEGLRRRCPIGIPERYHSLAEKELQLVGELGFAAYFLTVHDIVDYARSIGILCQGRGSAANSILCWALGITDVSPEQITMVFERFVSRYRGEPPDIDVDFEHERREEVIQYIYAKYGRHRAGICATIIHFRRRAAIREVGKVMGLSQDITTALAGQSWSHRSHDGRSITEPERLQALGLDPRDRRLAQTMRLIDEIIGFPRHLSQHVGGFIITQGRLDALCPIENAAMEDRTIIEWDKDDIDALGILKIDILSLGMLTCLRKSFDLLAQHDGQQLSIDQVPQEDPATYDMLCRADAVGVFQVESRAQMNFLPRMRPRTFYDLVIEVAIVRPGPIQGGMVHPYIHRRQGREAVQFPSGALEQVLGKTLGVPLFQEQAMQIAVVAAGFSAEEADRLRRSIATFQRMGTIGKFRDKFITGMLANGYTPNFAERSFAQLEGFGQYGFPESHAAAFAMLAYVSAWMKCHHPEVFTCALLNAQPMGFYAPAQLIRDLREHGGEVRPVCVNHSAWDNLLERRPDGRLALRLGFRQIKGLRKDDAHWLMAARGNGYRDPEALWLRAGLTPPVLERLAEADSFTDMGLTRREALWKIKAIRAPSPLPLFDNPMDGEAIDEPPVALPAMHLGEEVVEDYLALRLSLRAHPMELLRPKIPQLVAHKDLPHIALGRYSICGLVITRQRPGTASGVIFLTLEDETGVANVVVWPKLYQAQRKAVIGARLMRVTGYLQREGSVVHVIAQKVEDLSDRLTELGHPLGDHIGETTPSADEAPRPKHIIRKPSGPRAMHPRDQAKRLFPSRDFH